MFDQFCHLIGHTNITLSRCCCTPDKRIISQNRKSVCVNRLLKASKENIWRNPVYYTMEHTPPLLLFLIFVLFLCLFQVRFARQGQERGLVRAPQGQSPPQCLESEEKKSKIMGGGIFAPRAQHERVPNIHIITNKISIEDSLIFYSYHWILDLIDLTRVFSSISSPCWVMRGTSDTYLS